jgi:uncharacterized membrane protein YeaQ/YmgE (transglycosylase-associated protein family)
MIGMDFISFLTLLIISAAVSGVLHFGLKFYVRPGLSSYLGKVTVGWVGAWLGSPVFGHWWQGMNRGDVYFVPAILGSAALVALAVDLTKSVAGSLRAG